MIFDTRWDAEAEADFDPDELAPTLVIAPVRRLTFMERLESDERSLKLLLARELVAA